METGISEEDSMENIDDLKRAARQDNQTSLFKLEDNWEKDWSGMPEFSNDDIRPMHSITVNFLTSEDKANFAEKLNIKLTEKANSMWFPEQTRLESGKFRYIGEKTNSKYPICIPSKGRADCQTTGKALDKLGVDYKFFVEDLEYDEYCKYLGKDKVVKMPFNNLGQGSVSARNFIWDWAKEQGHKRHWTVDDNIQGFARTNHTRRLQVDGGGFFKAMEEFVDRYKNIAMAGPHHVGFVKVGWSNIPPFLLNSRVYSCILLDTTLDYRWRGRYNEDTDLSLRLLKDGYCTMLFCALVMQKGTTSGAKDAKPMKGGNTDNVYIDGDNRRKFAESLKEQHPDVVEVTWKFNRWHHQVNYKPFKKNKLIKKEGVIISEGINNYGMVLKTVDE
jgi:hypothetical protein